MTAVWQGYNGPRYLLLPLLALADFADDLGVCWPSVGTVARKSRLSRRRTQQALHELVAGGFVIVKTRSVGGPPGATTRYRVAIERLRGDTPVADDTGEVGDTGEAGNAYPRRQQRKPPSLTSPEPLRTVSEPSSLSRSARDAAEQRKVNGTQADAMAVLEFLNEKAKRRYRGLDARNWPTTSLRPIMARLRSGVSVDDCRSLIALKARQWSNDPKMAQYLRPSTLFGAKFEDYLGELGGES